MTDLNSAYFETGDMRIHYMHGGDPKAPIMLFLHGFPEFWAGWEPVMDAFAGDYHVVAPDQRGFNLTTKPQNRADYDAKYLVADMKALADELSPERPIILCGHDWGAAVAYAFAMLHPDRVEKLVIVNGVHPIPFQRALLAGGAQTKASQYMRRLREEGMEKVLAADDFAKLFSMFEKFSQSSWLDAETRTRYLEAWSQPGALDAMLNWYRTSPMIVPALDDAPVIMKITEKHLKRYHISMPHLLIWGMNDTALLPEAREGLEDFCDDLTVVEVEDGDHWIIHCQPERVSREIRGFLGR